MQRGNHSISALRRHLGHAVVATTLVAVVPVALVAAAPPFRSFPWYLSLVAGMMLSIALTQGANFAWVKWFGTEDLVFSDLMVWGWLRRLLVERRIERVAEKLRVLDNRSGAVALSIEAKTKILTDLVTSLEARDAYTHGHSRRVTRHAFMIAKAMGLAPEDVERIRIAASVHDVGKLGIPLSVIRKPGKLTDDEFAQIAQHSVKGAEMVAPLGDPLLTSIVRHHHERIDGSGYPDRLRADEIPLGARIIAVADTFDAITSTRAYRKAARHSAAIQIMKKEAGSQLDRDVVKAFLGYYTGRRSIEWWFLLTALPQRAWTAFEAWGRTAVALPTVQGIAAAGTAALVATSLGPVGSAPVPAERKSLHVDKTVAAMKHKVRRSATSASYEHGGETYGSGDGGSVDNDGGRRRRRSGNGKTRPEKKADAAQDHSQGGGNATAREAERDGRPASPGRPEAPASGGVAAVTDVANEAAGEVAAAGGTAPEQAADLPGLPAQPATPSKPSKPVAR